MQRNTDTTSNYYSGQVPEIEDAMRRFQENYIQRENNNYVRDNILDGGFDDPNYFPDPDMAARASMDHPYFLLVDHYRQEQAEMNYEGFYAQITARFMPARPPARCFRKMVIEGQYYRELQTGHRFLMSSLTSGSGYSCWEIYRHFSGDLYFVITTTNAMTGEKKYEVQCANGRLDFPDVYID